MLSRPHPGDSVLSNTSFCLDSVVFELSFLVDMNVFIQEFTNIFSMILLQNAYSRAVIFFTT